jgi:hypothetical protein
MAATPAPWRSSVTTCRPQGAEDLEQIVGDYSDDAIYITPAGVQPGKDGTRQAFTKLSEVPQERLDRGHSSTPACSSSRGS